MLFCNFWSKPCSARLLEQWTYYEVFVCNLQSSNRVKLLDVCKLQSKVNFVKGYFSFSTFFNMIGERLRSFPSEQYIPVSCCELRWKYFRKVHSEVGMDKIKAVKSSPLLSMSCITMVFGCLGWISFTNYKSPVRPSL